MGFFLSILALLGKIFLWVLGILCILLLLLLFWPIRYQLKGEFGDEVKVRGRIWWLWFLFRLDVSYEKNFEWRLRILGLDLMKFLDSRKENRDKKSQRRSRGQRDMEAADIKNEEESNHHFQEEKEGVCEESEELEIVQDRLPQIDVGRKEQQERIKEIIRNSTTVEQPAGQPVTRKIANFFRKWKRKLHNFISGIKSFFTHFRNKRKYVKEILSLLREDNSRAFVCIIKDNVVHLWRKIKPKVFRGHLLFGTGDPASTGEILGVFAILFAWYGNGIEIVPDFQEKVCEGKIFMKGSLSLFTVVLVAVRVLFSEEWKCLKERYDQIKAIYD